MNDELLKISLSAAVPLWIAQIQRNGLSIEQIHERAGVCGQVIAEKGDVILFRSKKNGATADAFNRLAEGIACLAFSPGGVTVFGLHFEAKHAAG